MVNALPGRKPVSVPLRPAEVIRIHEGGYTHWALVSDHRQDGRPMLISLSKQHRRVTEDAWADVVGAKRWDCKGHPGQLDAPEVLARARSWLGREGVYRLLGWNCQHFANWAHGLPATSPEVKETLGWAAAGAVVGILGENGNWKRAAMLAVVFGAVTMLARAAAGPDALPANGGSELARV